MRLNFFFFFVTGLYHFVLLLTAGEYSVCSISFAIEGSSCDGPFMPPLEQTHHSQIGSHKFIGSQFWELASPISRRQYLEGVFSRYRKPLMVEEEREEWSMSTGGCEPSEMSSPLCHHHIGQFFPSLPNQLLRAPPLTRLLWQLRFKEEANF